MIERVDEEHEEKLRLTGCIVLTHRNDIAD